MSRLVPLERHLPFGLGLGQHGVEHPDVVTAAPQGRGGDQGAQRRVGLHELLELGVESQVIRLAEQNVRHGLVHRPKATSVMALSIGPKATQSWPCP